MGRQEGFLSEEGGGFLVLAARGNPSEEGGRFQPVKHKARDAIATRARPYPKTIRLFILTFASHHTVAAAGTFNLLAPLNS